MRRILYFENDVSFLGSAAVGGKEEKSGPLGELFDFCDDDDRFGKDTWEAAEAELARMSLNIAMKKTNIKESDLDVLLAGDLENQCVASSSGLYSFGIPYVGLYSACSTATEALLLLSSLISNGNIKKGATITTSHNSAAERQFRTPIEYGGQRSPTSQWTATAGGAFILGSGGKVKIKEGLIGKIVDGLTTNAMNMGAAMARAAFDTIYTYFSLTKENPSSFDLIITGDLGKYRRAVCLVPRQRTALAAENVVVIGHAGARFQRKRFGDDGHFARVLAAKTHRVLPCAPHMLQRFALCRAHQKAQDVPRAGLVGEARGVNEMRACHSKLRCPFVHFFAKCRKACLRCQVHSLRSFSFFFIMPPPALAFNRGKPNRHFKKSKKEEAFLPRPWRVISPFAA